MDALQTIDNTEVTFQDDLSPSEQRAIRKALKILASRLKHGVACTNAVYVKNYCQLEIANEKDEVFCCLFLDNQHRVLAFERMFKGTIDGANVYPRVVVRRALELNAAALIFAHNHPSGLSEPSKQDIAITKRLREALGLVDIRVLDHIVVSASQTSSIAEAGLL
ncbi:JAB domain-containing protein [Zhongshania marina]|uniref:DNA repair protein RadC n=1 Tax=Zhongshania marina TaxID=2304603 RepID=A0ABX9W2V0_9GAMM|nr:DNA repair protein RadC [Zhongshania marina]